MTHATIEFKSERLYSLNGKPAPSPWGPIGGLHKTSDGYVRVLGFVTRDALVGLQLPEHVAVYLPQSYNFAGNLLIVPRSAIEPLSLSSGELMTFIVSGGVSGLGVGGPMLPAGVETPATEPTKG